VPKNKNIVLLSDGTGNSSSDLFRTNVWRLYQAIDVSRPDRQVAYYHDGVGTESNKYISAVTGIFGYGLKRGVLDMYMFLCRSYQPGDRIFGFGFSRGSFAIRILMGLVAKEGLAPYEGNDAQLAMDARAAYRRFRRGFTTAFHVEKPFRSLRDHFYGWVDPRSKTVRFHTLKGRDPDWIHFVGVFDTVDAYGGPIDEITEAIDYWIWPLTMPNQIPSEKIRRICHALSLDDERRAFWPRLFREDVVQRRDGERYPPGTGWQPPTVKEVEAWRGTDALPANFNSTIDRQRLTQVWFTGMHSDVGGSYPQDGLAHGALAWMMDRANVYGLLIRPLEEAELRRCANPLDKLNDSRSGFGAYYRYQPRNVPILRTAGSYTPFCVKAWNWLLSWIGIRRTTEPVVVPDSDAMIHESVFRRIEQSVNPYAPITLPGDYRVTDADGNVRSGPYWTAPRVDAPAFGQATPRQESPAEATTQVPEVEQVWNLVWARRVAYFITVLVSLVVALFPVYNDQCWQRHLLPHCRLTYMATPFGEKWLAPPIGWIESVIPSLVGKWTAVAQEVPEVVWGGVTIIVLLLFLSGYLETHIRTLMEQVWRRRAHHPPQTPWRAKGPARLIANSQGIYHLRYKPWYRELFAALRYCILPTLLVWGPISIGVGYLVSNYLPSLSVWGGVAGLWAIFILINLVCLIWAKNDVPPARSSQV
jgi:uncharacterized protein (DUF2235 family)